MEDFAQRNDVSSGAGGGEERVAELFEEGDDVELEGKVTPGERGEGLVEEGEADWVRGGPFVLPCAAVLEVVNQ